MSMHTRVVAMAAAVLLGAGSLALAPAASAAPPKYHGIDGDRGTVTDDWQDEENLGVDDHTKSNATALWQTVLWADRAEWQDEDGDSHTFEKSQIDGEFGPETESATQWWQDNFGLSDNDGVVTEQTWRAAQAHLSGPTRSRTVTYNGAQKASFKRISDKYQVRLKGTGPFKNASYDTLG
ncbi:peptidoglycan-binding protein [Streptomyces sp. NPDC059629]|uniref:peptidoglycan-binding domain-containing protein n=1 Tax=Streptomyces sp. NPDC059629 TaxID=3346889 RepID=UPI0036D0E62D